MSKIGSHRSYAIMTRAKHRAGIPLIDPSKPTKRIVPKEQKLKETPRAHDLNFRKPAGNFIKIH